MSELARNPSLDWDRDLVARGFINPANDAWNEVYLSTNPSLNWKGVKQTATAFPTAFPWDPMMLLENPCIFGP